MTVMTGISNSYDWYFQQLQLVFMTVMTDISDSYDWYIWHVWLVFKEVKKKIYIYCLLATMTQRKIVLTLHTNWKYILENWNIHVFLTLVYIIFIFVPLKEHLWRILEHFLAYIFFLLCYIMTVHKKNI